MDGNQSYTSYLKYLNKLENEIRSSENGSGRNNGNVSGGKRTQLLNHYIDAIDNLPEDWNDENYIIISVRHALLLLTTDEVTARTFLNLIGINCSNAQVFIAMAEYYLQEDDTDGARTCLERAKKRNAVPRELIIEAMKVLDSGGRTLGNLIDTRFYYRPPTESKRDSGEAAVVEAALYKLNMMTGNVTESEPEEPSYSDINEKRSSPPGTTTECLPPEMESQMGETLTTGDESLKVGYPLHHDTSPDDAEQMDISFSLPASNEDVSIFNETPPASTKPLRTCERQAEEKIASLHLPDPVVNRSWDFYGANDALSTKVTEKGRESLRESDLSGGPLLAGFTTPSVAASTQWTGSKTSYPSKHSASVGGSSSRWHFTSNPHRRSREGRLNILGTGARKPTPIPEFRRDAHLSKRAIRGADPPALNFDGSADEESDHGDQIADSPNERLGKETAPKDAGDASTGVRDSAIASRALKPLSRKPPAAPHRLTCPTVCHRADQATVGSGITKDSDVDRPPEHPAFRGHPIPSAPSYSGDRCEPDRNAVQRPTEYPKMMQSPCTVRPTKRVVHSRGFYRPPFSVVTPQQQMEKEMTYQSSRAETRSILGRPPLPSNQKVSSNVDKENKAVCGVAADSKSPIEFQNVAESKCEGLVSNPAPGGNKFSPVDQKKEVGQSCSEEVKKKSDGGKEDDAFSFGKIPDRKSIRVNGEMYNISSVIGRGGSSVVYQATNGGGDIVAIKVVSFDTQDQNVISSYKNEVDILLRLQETGRVIRLFDHEITSRGMALVMERAEVDFKSVLAHLSRKNAIMLWRQMLQCVEVLHLKGVVHLDLKPSNFVLVNGVPKLIDLGISHSIPDDMTSVTLQHTMGTLDYMSPEQLSSFTDPKSNGKGVKNRIGRSSDVWALGCILHLLMFGKPPFRGTHILERMAQIISDQPVPIADFPELPKLKEVLEMCLQKNPAKRPPVSVLLKYFDGVR